MRAGGIGGGCLMGAPCHLVLCAILNSPSIQVSCLVFRILKIRKTEVSSLTTGKLTATSNEKIYLVVVVGIVYDVSPSIDR